MKQAILWWFSNGGRNSRAVTYGMILLTSPLLAIVLPIILCIGFLKRSFAFNTIQPLKLSEQLSLTKIEEAEHPEIIELWRENVFEEAVFLFKLLPKQHPTFYNNRLFSDFVLTHERLLYLQEFMIQNNTLTSILISINPDNFEEKRIKEVGSCYLSIDSHDQEIVINCTNKFKDVQVKLAEFISLKNEL